MTGFDLFLHDLGIKPQLENNRRVSIFTSHVFGNTASGPSQALRIALSPEVAMQTQSIVGGKEESNGGGIIIPEPRDNQ